MAQHTTARLYCTKDTHVSKSYPTQNFHNAEYTNMGVAGGQQNTALLAFNTNHGITSGARILSAKLHFAIKYASDTGTYTYTVRPCGGSWTETGVTWNTIPTTGDVSDTASISNSTRAVDITNTFKAWFAGAYAMSNGLYITCATASSRKQIYPRGYTTEDYRPYLTIEWEDPISVPVPEKSAYALGETLNLSMQGAGSDRTHNITYKIGGTTVRTATGVGASDAYALPLDLASNIVSATSATMMIICETIIGGASQGTASTSVSVSVPGSVVPTISGVEIAETAASWPSTLAGKWVQNASKPKITISAAGAYGSTIKSYSAQIGGASASGNPAQFGVLTQAGTLAVTVKVVDSRGRSASYSANISVAAYTPPSVAVFQATRCNSEGTADDSGLYLRIAANVSASSLDGLNTLACKVQYRQTGNTVWQDSDSLAVSNLAVNAVQVLSEGGIFSDSLSYEVRLETVDLLTTSYTYTSVSTRTVYLDINCNGTGVGIGAPAAEDGNLALGLSLKTATDAVRAQSMQNLTYIGINPAFEDTTVNWGAKGPCYTWYNTNGVSSVADQPSQYGFLISIPYGPSGNYGEVRQIWASQPNGALYHRGGNANGWTSWKQMIDSTGGTIDGALSVAGDFTAKNGVLLPETEQGLTGKLYADYGAIVLESSNSDSANKRMLSVDNLTFQSDTRYAMRVIEIREGVYSAYYIPVQTNWIELTPADGVTTPGEYGNGVLRYRAEGKHVYVAGSINATWDGTNDKLIATLPSGYRPANGNCYFLQVRGGQNISRFCVHADGGIYIEWVKNLSDGNSNTGSGWFDLNMDFWTD